MPTVGLVTFDTLKFVENLTAAGMPEEQARALATAQADIMTNSLATKDDLALYYQQGEAKFNELDTRIEKLDAKVDTKFNELDAKVDSGFALLRSEMVTMQKDILIKLGGLMVVLFGLFFGFLKSFPL